MNTLRAAARIISIVLFAVTFLAVFAQVILRYIFEMPAGWTVEVALNSFLFGAWWTIVWLVALRDHVKFDVVYSRLPLKGQLVCRAAGGVAVCILLIAALPAAVKYVGIMNRITTGVLKMPLSWVYSVFVLFLVVMALRLLFDAISATRQLLIGGSAKE